MKNLINNIFSFPKKTELISNPNSRIITYIYILNVKTELVSIIIQLKQQHSSPDHDILTDINQLNYLGISLIVTSH